MKMHIRYPPNRIFQAIKRSRYTQEKVAKLLGYKSTSCLSAWQNNRRLPSLSHAFALAVALSTSVDALFPEFRRQWEAEINPRRERIAK